MIRYFESVIGDKSSVYFILGHAVELYRNHIIHLELWEHFSVLKIINIGLSFATSQWLNSIMRALTTDRDHWSLRA